MGCVVRVLAITVLLVSAAMAGRASSVLAAMLLVGGVAGFLVAEVAGVEGD